MAKDFKASQVRTTQIIASGSTSGKPSLVILSASSPGVNFDGSGISSIPSAVGNDVFIFVSGSTASKNTTVQGVTLFGGDIMISGTAYGTAGAFAVVAGSDTQVQFNDGGTALGGDSGLTYNKTTDTLTVGGDLAVNGGDLTSTQTTFNLLNNTVTTLNIGGAATTIEIGAATGNTSINNGLTVDGNTTLGNATTDTTTVAGSLAVNGTAASSTNKITSTQTTFNLLNDTVTTLNIGGAATAVSIGNSAGTVTVPGNLTVDGTTTTVNTTNLVVKDPLIYFGSGTTSSNQNGGIALASGSSTTNQALVWGRVDSDTWGAGKLDVTAGTKTDLTAMNHTPVRASSYQLGGSNAVITSSDASNVTISTPNTSAGFIKLTPGTGGLRFGLTTAPTAITASSVRFGGNSAQFGNEIPSLPGVDTFFFVSGSISSRGNSSGKMAVFGGHTMFSGAIYGGVNADVGRTLLRQEAAQIAFSKEDGLTAGSVTGTDIFMFVSGAIDSKNTATRGTSVFGGDVDISGSLHIEGKAHVTGNLELYGNLLLSDDSFASSAVKRANLNSSIDFNSNGVITLNADSIANGGYVQFQRGATSYLHLSSTSIIPDPGNLGARVAVLRTASSFVRGFGFTKFGGDDLTSFKDDVFFFVSGASGSKISGERGVAVFGGDVVISGTLHGGSPLKVSGSMALSGSLSLQTQDSAPSVGNNESVLYVLDSGGTKKLYWKNSDGVQQEVGTGGGGTPGGSDTQIQFNDGGSFGGNNGLKYDKNTQTLSVGNLIVTGSTTVLTSTNVTISDQMIYLASGSKVSNTNGGIAITSGSSVSNQALVWGRVANDTWGAGRQDVTAGTTSDLTSMTLVPVRSSKFEIGGSSAFVSSSNGSFLEIGAATQVLVLSGGAASSPNPRNFADTNFFVSGTIATAGSTTVRGTAVFGGDTFVSGQIFFGGDSSSAAAVSRFIQIGQTAYIQNWNPTAPIFQIAGKFGAALSRLEAIASTTHLISKVRIGGALADSPTAYLHLSSSTGAATTAPLKFQSGSLMTTPEAGAVEFNGVNLFITSGTTRQTFLTTLANNAAVTSSFMVSTASNMTLRVPGNVVGETAQSIIFTNNGSPTPTIGSDTFLYVTGTRSSKDTSTRGTSVFAGDVVVSGAIYGGVQFGSSTELTIQANKVQVTANTLSIGQSGGNDVSFFVSGSAGSRGGASPGTALIGGDLVISGSTYIASGSSIFPAADLGSNLGSPSNRFGNIYTGDLHLRNERGDWTIVEEEDYLCVVNNKTGKKFKMALIPLEE